jgi:hypothetical protein
VGTVYAVDTANIMMPDESMVLIQKGEPWSTDAEVVRFKPQLFTTEPDQPAPTSIGPGGIPVEQATAAPGEKRNVRR